MRTLVALAVLGTVLLLLLIWWPGGTGVEGPGRELPPPQESPDPDPTPRMPGSRQALPDPAPEPEGSLPAGRDHPDLPAGTVAGVVLDDSGQRLPGLVVWLVLRRENGEEPAPIAPRSLETDELGAFRFDDLEEGEYELQVRPPPGYAPHPPAIVRAGMENVETHLRRVPGVTVRVLDPSGAPVENARVTAVKKAPPIRVVNGTTGPDGSVTFSGMDGALEWALTVSPPPNRPGLRRVGKPNWKPGETTLTLESAFRTAGVVLDLVSDTSVPHADVIWRDGKESRMTTCDDRGRFEILSASGLPIRLRARAGDVQSEEIEVAAGTEDATLRLDLGICLTVRAESWPRGRLPAPASLVRAGEEAHRHAAGSHAGVWVFPQLVEGAEYTLRIAGTPDGSSLVLPGVRAKRGEITVKPSAGHVIRGRLVLPADARVPRVSATAFGLSVGALVDGEGRFEFRGLTDESWTVTGECTVNGARWRGQTSGRPGEPVEIEVSLAGGR